MPLAITKLKWYQIALLIIASAVVLFQIFVGAAFYLGFRGTGTPITLIRQLFPDVPLSFPADAIVINGEYHKGLGGYLIAKVRFKRSEVHAFISQPLLASNGTNIRSELMQWRSSDPEMRRFNWQLKSIHNFWAVHNVECRPNDGNSQAYMLIDLDNPVYVDIYIDRQYH